MASSSSSSSADWLILVATILLQTINGPNSDFPVYSSQLKELKGISQVQVNFLAFASDTGKLLGWLSGVAALHWPLWLVAFTGASFVLVGYGVQYLFLDTAGLRFRHMSLLTALAGNGICWTNTVCQLLFVSNVVASRSPVAVSLVTSYLGLSAMVYTSLAEAMPRLATSKTKTYLLLDAVVPMLVTVVVAPFLRVVDLKGESSTDKAFLFMFAIALATFMVGIISSTKRRMIGFVVLLAMPILIPVALRIREIWGAKREIREIWGAKRENTVPHVGRADAVIDIATVETEEDTVAVAVVEVGGLLLLKKLDFWLYFSYMLSATLRLVFSNN